MQVGWSQLRKQSFDKRYGQRQHDRRCYLRALESQGRAITRAERYVLARAARVGSWYRETAEERA